MVRNCHQSDRNCHQILKDETHTLSASSFNDEETSMINFDPRLYSNIPYVKPGGQPEKVDKKSKKIHKKTKSKIRPPK